MLPESRTFGAPRLTGTRLMYNGVSELSTWIAAGLSLLAVGYTLRKWQPVAQNADIRYRKADTGNRIARHSG